MGEVLKKFGRYFLLDRLAQGGMAEIYRARLASVDGAGRLLVIKCIQPGYGANAEFLQMFKSEIKVMMGLNHPNIVQLYDFGEEQGQPYIAMEYVDGKNLRQFITRFNELKQTFPVELAAHLIEQAACGLYYAHTFKDKITGEPLNIIHRDISPQNVLISYEGNVKVIDFGIAKATTNNEATRAGVIKGKPSYLSPEQINGDPLDGRCDIFALGTVLWELLTGKKLFAGENDLAVLKLIESCQTYVKPPSTVNPRVPKELDYIVLKALAKQKEKRYQTADEFQRALHKFLYNYMPDFNPTDLSHYAKDLFKDQIVEDRKRIQRLYEKVDQLMTLDLPPNRIVDYEFISNEKPEDTTTVVEARPKSTGARDVFSANVKNAPVEIESPRGGAKRGDPAQPGGAQSQRPRPSAAPGPAASDPAANTMMSYSRSSPQQRQATRQTASSQTRKSSKMRAPLFLAVAAVLGVVFLGPDFFNRSEDSELILLGQGSNLAITVNGQSVGNLLPIKIPKITPELPLRIVVKGDGGTFQQEVTLRKGESRKVNVAFPAPGSTVSAANGSQTAPSQPASSNGASRSVTLRLNFLPGGATPKAMINGRTIDTTNPVVTVPLDAPLELVAERVGFKPFRREFVLSSNEVTGKEWVMDVPLEPIRFGFLSVNTTPSAEATIMIDGKAWVKRTPIENEKLPIGTYNIRLVNEVLGMEKTITVSIQEGKVISKSVQLEINRGPAEDGR